MPVILVKFKWGHQMGQQMQVGYVKICNL